MKRFLMALAASAAACGGVSAAEAQHYDHGHHYAYGHHRYAYGHRGYVHGGWRYRHHRAPHRYYAHGYHH